jgi:aryl-alcohol dehydrogenase-like predicted oxidoreductase
MRFYVYNPLAGGVLTGRYTYEDQPDSGRFDCGTPWGVKYRERYEYE